jgi:hypothetical protein
VHGRGRTLNWLCTVLLVSAGYFNVLKGRGPLTSCPGNFQYKAAVSFRDDSEGSFLAVTCGNGHIALAGLNQQLWCRIVWDSVVVNLSLWEIMSDLAVTNIGTENHGVESLWAAPAGLTATAHDALEKAHT